MINLLFFTIGLLMGGTISCVFMAGFQLHRIRKYEYEIAALKYQLKKNMDKIN